MPHHLNLLPLALAALAVPAVLAVPAAPAAWTSVSTTTVSLVNGQTQTSAGTQYQSDAAQASRFEPAAGSGRPTTVTLFDGPHGGMEMEVDANNKCVAWCPPSSTYFNQIRVGNGKNGTSVAKEISPNTWQWSDLLIIVKMDTKELAFASDGTTPQTLDEQITPFGKAIGNSTTTFTTFKPSADVSKFQPTGVENCPKASGCQQSVSSMRVSYQVEQLLKEF
jgi:hypothetical protein